MNGLATVGFDVGFGAPRRVEPGEDVLNDLLRVFAARVVGGDDDMVGQLLGDPGHSRTFGLVPLASTAEHDYHPSACNRPPRSDHIPQCVVGVGVVHEDLVSARGGHPFQPPRYALDRLKGLGDMFQVNAQDPRGPGRRQTIENVVTPDQGRVDAQSPAGRDQVEDRPVGVD